jgi:hypothetical protein
MRIMRVIGSVKFHSGLAAAFLASIMLVPAVFVTATATVAGADPFSYSFGNAVLPDAVAGQPYSAQIVVNGTGGPWTLALSGGVLPPGLSMSPSGVVSGTPVQQTDLPVQSRFLPSVTDHDGDTLTGQDALITVDPAGYVAPPPLEITTTSLPTAKLATRYSASLQASGGVPPYTWSIFQGALPDGLTLSNDGTISGTPRQVQQTSFIVEVSDSGTQNLNTYQRTLAGQIQSQQFTIKVTSGVAELDPTLTTVFSTLDTVLGTVGTVQNVLGRVPSPECIDAGLQTLINHAPPDPNCF